MKRRFQLNPATQKRLRRFKRFRRAYVSAWLLGFVCLLTLCADLLCNDKPLMVRFEGRAYFPLLRFYAESEFVPHGKPTRPNYKVLDAMPVFREQEANFMVFPPIPYGPRETISEESLKQEGRVVVTFLPIPRVSSVNISSTFIIERSRAAESFFPDGDDALRGTSLDDYWPISPDIRKAIEARFANKASDRIKRKATARFAPHTKAEMSLSTFKTRSKPPSTVRLTFRMPDARQHVRSAVTLDKGLEPIGTPPDLWKAIAEGDKTRIGEKAKAARTQAVDALAIDVGDRQYQALFNSSIVWPYPPIGRHLLGIDAAGRDVLSRIVHGLRVSLLFGVLLVISSMLFGTTVGAIQGFYGGFVDITGQRIIEIWSAIPFLYVMILLGSIYGAHFWLLLLVYAIFNWISISYYMRAEFLRLRKQPFVDAARVLGIGSHKIIFRHVLPNAVTPLITFMPFYLVRAIASLAALDYLGFGLPALTPSLGQLLHQAQAHRSAWWLILYPSLALFIVMLLGVFVGEGVREAYDPRPRSKME